MIIQCDQCQTKFKLDDAKAAEKSIKVRCATCRHVFSVGKTEPAPEEETTLWQDEPTLPTEAEQDFAAPIEEMEPEIEPETPPVVDSATPDADEEGFFFPPAESEEKTEQAEPQEAPEEMDFGAFDFGGEGNDEAETAAKAPEIDLDVKPAEPAPAAAPAKKDFGGLDFSDDDMFGEVVSPTSEEDSKESISFDMGIEGFADSMGVESASAGQDDMFATQDTAAENPFSLDDVDFGDELTSVAVQQVSAEELKPSQDGLFAPLAASDAQPVLTIPEETPAIPAAAMEEAPAPLTSRRKEGSRISGMLLLLWAMIAGLIVFYSVWGIKTLSELKAGAAKEAGRITVRSVEANYVKHKKLGTLLVISGEAVNEYNKPRASIQVRGVVYGADGAEIASKSAFCGNPLSEDELATMTMEKIEAAMANEFGDSLANMEVAPGGSIPFVVVIPKPVEGATDYGVEPAGSTVATDKPKEK